MEYYVIYDLEDNLMAYIETKIELSKYTGLRVPDINYKFKGKDFIYSYVDEKKLKIYKF